MIYLDTHVVAWLYFGQAQELSRDAAAAIESSPLFISPMVLLELGYLHELGRLAVTAEKIVQTLAGDIGLEIAQQPFADVARQALHETWTRDPFDRLIVAQAKLSQSRLLSRDRLIRQHYRHAIW